MRKTETERRNPTQKKRRQAGGQTKNKHKQTSKQAMPNHPTIQTNINKKGVGMGRGEGVEAEEAETETDKSQYVRHEANRQLLCVALHRLRQTLRGDTAVTSLPSFCFLFCFVCLFVFFVLFFFCVPRLYLWGSPLLGEIFAYVTVFLIQSLR